MRRARALVVAAMAAAASNAPGLPTLAQEPAPRATTAATAGTGELRLLDRTPWVGDGLDFALSVLVTTPPAGSQLQVTVHDRVRSRSEFARTIDGEGLRRSLSGPSPVPLATLDADGDGAVPLLVSLVARDGGQQPLSLRAGVYPVVVELLDADGTVLDALRTHLVRLPGADPDRSQQPLQVATVVPVHAPPAHLDPAGPEMPDTSLSALTELLSAHPGVPVTLAPTPETIAAVAATDPAAVATLAAVLDGDEVLTSPWVDLDEAAWVRADDGELARQLARGRETLASLLGVQPAPIRLVPSGAVPAEVAAIVTHGASAVVVDDADLDELDPRDFPYTPGRPFQLLVAGDVDDPDATTVPALAADEDLTSLAGEADDDPVLAAHHVLADLAVIADDEPESARVMTLVLPEAAGTAFLTELLEGLEPPPAPPVRAPEPVDPEADPEAPVPEPPPAIPAASPVLVGATLEAALTAVEPAGADGGADADDPLRRQLITEGPIGRVTDPARRLASLRTRLTSFRGIFGPADPVAAGVDAVLATAASGELRATARAGALEAVDRDMAGRLAGLHGPAGQQVTLTARQGRIQLVLTNDTGRPADVVLELRGDRLVLPDAPDGRVPIRLAEQTTRLDLRVEARSSGDAPLDLRLTSPDGRLDLGQSRITVRTTAVSGVGILLMGAAAAFLAAWWTRTILRDRRSARQRHPAHVRST